MSATHSFAVEPSATRTDQPDLAGILERLRAAYRRAPSPDRAERVDRLNRLHNALLEHKDALAASMAEDFGGRAEAETLLMEILPLLEAIRHSKRHLRRWMKPSRRQTPILLAGCSSRVVYQPLGVVGIVVPWNFPAFLSLGPLICAFAAELSP